MPSSVPEEAQFGKKDEVASWCLVHEGQEVNGEVSSPWRVGSRKTQEGDRG